MNRSLAELCVANGVLWRYKDGAGEIREAPDESCIAILDAMGVALSSEQVMDPLVGVSPRRLPEMYIAPVNRRFQIKFETDGDGACDWRILLEDGDQLTGSCQGSQLNLPALPMGIHQLCLGQDTCCLISAPSKLASPNRGWGITASLYGLRSQRNGGLGDFADLAQLATQCAELGADFLGINPIHAGFSVDAKSFSPYSPSSRQMLNTLHIALDQLPEWPEISSQYTTVVATGALVDYPQVKAWKSAALRAAFGCFLAKSGAEGLQKFCAERGENLRQFAIHQALSEKFGAYWNSWPTEFQSSSSESSAKFAANHPYEIQYHCWLQWCATRQIEAAQKQAQKAGMAHGLYLDLAVGTHPYGAETWADKRNFVHNVSLGAPEDSFSAIGQNWELAPLNPVALLKDNFTTFTQTLRAQLRFAGMLRIDHILGFERAFWIPGELPGAYVKMPRDALLAITRIEAAKAGAVIIGEDLGNVPEGLRDELAATGVFGSRVAMFERDWNADKHFHKPSKYTAKALASLSTHDLPTVTGWAQGRDIDWRRDLGEITTKNATAEHQQRREDVTAFATVLPNHEPLEESKTAFNLAAHDFLAQTKSILVAVQVEDVLGLVEQANLPGTIDAHPNWRRRLPVKVEKLAGLEMMRMISELMARAGRGSRT